ncbi:DUF3788 family protein [Candidatus Enterococcus ferrettii]|uniref:DUF3788 domain-containing protein n=1 Tax=Candidatus Enterococcus ferrettii TaxID=2815324 RepID=A0ABV0EUE0_9ENTE|nr:DUF3788 family protein [Enterococcus sp. 665A]MBO1339437.1 DUF3788 family protein [Enterococcus sp. 665A]
MEETKHLSNKKQRPTEEQIQMFIGKLALQQLEQFEDALQKRYDLQRELRFPFGKQEGWGYRYAHKKSLLCYLFFEEGGIACTLSINDKGASKVEAILAQLQPQMQRLWKERYPCGEQGGWLHPKIRTEQDLTDILSLIAIKVSPKKS